MTTILKAFVLIMFTAISQTAHASNIERNEGNIPAESVYPSELRLMPEGCYAKIRDKDTVESCNKEWVLVTAEKEACETGKQGVLIRDDARRKVICVKKN
jgi:hypothetical protein